MRKVLREDGHKNALFTDRLFELQNVVLAEETENKFAKKNAIRNLEKSGP